MTEATMEQRSLEFHTMYEGVHHPESSYDKTMLNNNIKNWNKIL